MAPRNTRNRRNERTATAGSWRLERWRQADSWPTKAVILEARRDDQLLFVE
jgi:hypothetical protein